jgi:SAM-dependent methyltransferase
MRRLYEVFCELDSPCDKFLHYFDALDPWLARFVDTAPRVLEIGVQFGGSAEMYRKYFGEGTKVFGIDWYPRCEETDYLSIIRGDQGSEDFWNDFIKTHEEESFDLIVDDGSHDNPHQKLTLWKTFPLLKEGGVYVCEDVHTSYYRGVRVRDGGLRNPESFIEFAKSLIDTLNARHTRFAIGHGPTPEGPHVDPTYTETFKKLNGIHFYDSLVVLSKDRPITFKRVNSSGEVTYNSIQNPPEDSFTG